MWLLVTTIEEIIRGFDKCFDALEKFKMGDFPPEMAPEHFYRIEPWAVSW